MGKSANVANMLKSEGKKTLLEVVGILNAEAKGAILVAKSEALIPITIIPRIRERIENNPKPVTSLYPHDAFLIFKAITIPKNSAEIP
jgi:hypothetical protein